MITTVQTYAKCGSEHLRKNGSYGAKYHCKACNFHGRFSDKTAQRTANYEQVEQLLLERNRRAAPSQRRMARITGISRPTIARLTKKSRSK